MKTRNSIVSGKEMNMSLSRPFEGIRVIEMANFVAAPVCGRMLTDWGAEVIKVETLGGDTWRVYGKNVCCPATEEENPVFDIYNLNKKSVQINTKTPEGKEALLRLIESADVFLTNTRAKALKKSGLDYESLKDRFPRLIYAQVTGYGQEGPDVDAPGFDGVAFFARSGLMVDLADPSGYPYTAPGCFGDAVTGTALFGAINAALYAREKTGKGDFVEVSLLGSATWMLACLLTFTEYGYQYPKQRTMINPLVNCYKCNDDEWIQVSLVDPSKWDVLAKTLDLAYLLEDERFCNPVVIGKNRAELIPILEAQFMKYSSKEILKKLSDADLVASRLRHIKELKDDPQNVANGYVRPFTFASGTDFMMPTPPVRSANIGEMPLDAAPLAGADTDEILQSIGYSASEIIEMKDKGAVHQHD